MKRTLLITLGILLMCAGPLALASGILITFSAMLGGGLAAVGLVLLIFGVRPGPSAGPS